MKLLRQALATGLVGGAAWGALEALLALLRTGLPMALQHGVAPPTRLVDVLSVTVLAALDYALVVALFTILAAPVARLLGAWDDHDLAAPRALVAGAVFVNLYWWTKPWWAFSWGLPFLHPKRLALCALWAALAAGVAWATVRHPRRPAPWRWLLALGLLGLGLLGALLELVAPDQAIGLLATDHASWLGQMAGKLAHAGPEARLSALLGWVSAALLLALATLRPGWWAVPRTRSVVTVVVVLALGGGWATWRERQLLDHSERVRPAGDAPNVLLVINDAMRADRLGCYGNVREPPVSPNIDRLAQQGVLFERAVTQAPFTWTSFGSFLTGKYPRKHGLMKMLPNQRLDPQANRTIAAALSDAGYVTGAFLTGTLSNNSGLLAGFDTYFEALVGHDPVTRASKWSIVRSDLLLRKLRNKLRQALDPRLVNTMALDWMAEQAGRPFFAMVHYYETHTPYDPPAPYDWRYDPDYKGPFHPFTQSLGVEVLRQRKEGREVFTERDHQHLLALYDGGVAFADEMVGALLDRLDELGIADNTLVIVTADHGEELFDHGVFEHDWMFNTNLLVPLVMRLPGGACAGTKVDCPVELIDLPSTILAVTGHGSLATPEDPGADAVSGRSLLPDCHGTHPSEDQRWVFSENNRYVAMQDGRSKIIVNRVETELPPRVFDLRADPHEMAPLHDDALTRDLLARLAAWDLTQPSLQGAQHYEDDPEMEKRLTQTGYLGPNQNEEETLPPVAPHAAPPAPGAGGAAGGCGS
ncbi:MAG TPA: sulfatase [Planctomycetota bacterium]|nr:sulfatase [Planctomycetota bacterium]